MDDNQWFDKCEYHNIRRNKTSRRGRYKNTKIYQGTTRDDEWMIYWIQREEKYIIEIEK